MIQPKDGVFERYREMKHLPNILSGFRIALVPLFVAVWRLGGEYGRLWAAGIFLLAAVTDFLDGYLARKYHYITNLGKILDPAGDKLMTLAMVLCLSLDGIIPGWIFWFYLVKEGLMAAGGLFVRAAGVKDVPPSNFVGKTATFVLFCTGAALMIFKMPPAAARALMVLAVLVSLAALLSYVPSLLALLKKRRAEN